MDIVTYAALRKLINNAQAVASDCVYFTTTYDEATDTTTFNGTLEELQAAFDSGKKVYIDGSEFEWVSNEGSEDVLTAIEIFMQDGLLLLSAKITADSVITILSTDFLLQTGNLATEISEESTDEEVPTAKTVYDAVSAATEIFYVPFKLGATGFELDGVTHADIMAAYQEGKRIVGKGYVPSAANIGFSGMFELPLSYFADNSSFVLTLISGQTTCELWVNSDNTIIIYMRTLVSLNDNVTGELNASSTDTQIPSAKAVYDYVSNASNASDNGFTVIDLSGEPDIDGDIYPDEATEAKIAEVIASASPAAIRWNGGLLFYYVGLDVFVTSIHYPEGHSNQKLTYQKDQHLLVLSPFLN